MNIRQKQILQAVEREGEVTIKSLAETLQVSEMTIHRDADQLQAEGCVYKKRGAIVFIENADRGHTDFYAEEKRAIGIRAASLIKAGQSILFDNSTTGLACAKALDPSQKYVFYATGMETANALAEYEQSILYCSGGYYFPASRGFVGAQAEAFVASLKVDVCIIGASGISIENGITTPYPMHTAIQKAIITAAKTKILVCDHSKFDKTAMEKICPLNEIDLIVTDKEISNEVLATYSKHVKIITA